MAGRWRGLVRQWFVMLVIVALTSLVHGQPSISGGNSLFLAGDECTLQCSEGYTYSTSDTLPTVFPLTWSYKGAQLPAFLETPRRVDLSVTSFHMTYTTYYKITVQRSDNNQDITCTSALTNPGERTGTFTFPVNTSPDTPVITGPKQIISGRNYTWHCQVDGASKQAPEVTWNFANGTRIVDNNLYSNTVDAVTDTYGIRMYNVSSSLRLVLSEGAPNFTLACEGRHVPSIAAGKTSVQASLPVTVFFLGQDITTTCPRVFTEGENDITCTFNKAAIVDCFPSTTEVRGVVMKDGTETTECNVPYPPASCSASGSGCFCSSNTTDSYVYTMKFTADQTTHQGHQFQCRAPCGTGVATPGEACDIHFNVLGQDITTTCPRVFTEGENDIICSFNKTAILNCSPSTPVVQGVLMKNGAEVGIECNAPYPPASCSASGSGCFCSSNTTDSFVYTMKFTANKTSHTGFHYQCETPCLNGAVTPGPACAINFNGNTEFPNPCTHAAIDAGQVLFPYPYDVSKFIRCDVMGNAHVTLCPDRKIFNPNTLTCGYNMGGELGTPLPTTYPNPCTPENIIKQYMYFAYTPNRHMYIHCDLWGDAFLVECPVLEVWSQSDQTCVADTPAHVLTTTKAAPTIRNPCTPENIALGRMYHPYPCDHTRFIHCDITGQYWVQVCPGGMYYNPATYICGTEDVQHDEGEHCF